jgi:hypothetical protein
LPLQTPGLEKECLELCMSPGELRGPGCSYEPQKTLEILGAACDTILDTDSVTLDAHFPCGVVIE